MSGLLDTVHAHQPAIFSLTAQAPFGRHTGARKTCSLATVEHQGETRGQRIRRLREDAGLSQGKLGEAIGVSRQTISLWEMGDYRPSAEHLAGLSDKLKKPEAYIMFGAGPDESTEDSEKTHSKKSQIDERFLTIQRAWDYDAHGVRDALHAVAITSLPRSGKVNPKGRVTRKSSPGAATGATADPPKNGPAFGRNSRKQVRRR